MNPDMPIYATLIGAAIVGLALAVFKSRKPEANIALTYVATVTIATIASAALHASQTDFIFLQHEGQTIDGVIPLLLGFGLLLGLVVTVSGLAYWLLRLYCIAASARKDMK
jgi:hypothetical protein